MDRYKENELITDWQTRNFKSKRYVQPDDSEVAIRLSQEFQKIKQPKTANLIRFGSIVLGFLFLLSILFWIVKWIFISFHWFDIVILTVYSIIAVAQIRFDISKGEISD